jgi:arylsulfatase
MQGKSLFPIFKGNMRQAHEALYWEHLGSVAVREGKWKLVAARTKKWELFDLSQDRTEIDDLIEKFPEKAQELHGEWLSWANMVGVNVTEIHKNV